ncbi:MAG TPA: putative zinc-binding metallopeptidase, partial [Candidatus Pelagibacter bacterium]|nr:putative zinc-binding metallopeptidase [Candidatus Pelagibacter bacterium]
GFKYAKCSTCTNKLDFSLINNTKGFLTEYSMSTASEDMAETFSFLMTKKKKLESIVLNDPILNKKTMFLKNAVLKIDNNFKFN